MLAYFSAVQGCFFFFLSPPFFVYRKMLMTGLMLELKVCGK